jgi:dienelactone hydrolase
MLWLIGVLQLIPTATPAVAQQAMPTERGTVTFRPGPQERSVPERFRLAPAVFEYRMQPVLETERYVVSRVTFPSPIVTPDVEINTIHAEYFVPKANGRKHPGVVVLHILGADFPLSRYMAARLADRGVAALFMKLPYYGERRPEGDGANAKKFLSTDIERTVTSMRQGICDVRRAACWLASRDDIDANRLGVTGISLGGIVSSVAAAVDPAIRDGAFLLAGGDLTTVMWDMPEGAKFRDLWIQSGRTREDLRALTEPFDPLTYASGLKGKRIFMMAGTVDEVIPAASARALWQAAGRPEIHWYDCGHYSSVGFLLPALRRTVEFFAGVDQAVPK